MIRHSMDVVKSAVEHMAGQQQMGTSTGSSRNYNSRSGYSVHKASHVTRTRKAHQITAAALYILQHHAYENYSLTCLKDGQTQMDFKAWCDERKQNCPQLQYWATIMELEVCILTYVRSLREVNLAMYLDALTELVPWFFARDRTNYACWIPVHLRDMAEILNTPRCL